MQTPRLRDGNRKRREPYPLNEIPDDVVKRVGRHLTGILAIGRRDVGGDDWGDAWAYAIDGKHLASPLGLVDVVRQQVGWSTKTVKTSTSAGPHGVRSIRLISGRNSPDYSWGITDLHKDLQATGDAVLSIWNARVLIAEDGYWPNRTAVLIRSHDLLSYTLFEEPLERFEARDFEWKKNAQGNLVGVDRKTEETRFTWQFHGSQFTIHTRVPLDATKFQIMRPPPLKLDDLLATIDYSEEWTTILPKSDSNPSF